MADNLRKAVGVVTNYVFPAPKYNNAPDVQQLYMRKSSQDYVSSLPLQMALYFDLFYFPFWLITEIVMFAGKFNTFNSGEFVFKVVVPVIFVCVLIVEIIRLYIAYVGNLMEKVPELAGFWLLTLLIQLPLVLFLLLYSWTLITALEYAVTIIMTLFLIIEVVVGYFAIRTMVNYQVTKFHVQQFTNLERIPDPYNPSDGAMYGAGDGAGDGATYSRAKDDQARLLSRPSSNYYDNMTYKEH